MLHIICRVHHVLFNVVDHFTLRTKFWRKTTLLECMDVCLMNLQKGSRTSRVHKSMVHILGMPFFLLWQVKGNGMRSKGSHCSQGMLMSRAELLPWKLQTPLGRRDAWAAKAQWTPRAEIPGVCQGERILIISNSCLGNNHTHRTPQSSGMSVTTNSH